MVKIMRPTTVWCYCLDMCEGASSFAHHCFCTLSISVNMVKKATNSLVLLSISLYLLGPERILGDTQTSVDHTCFSFLIFRVSSVEVMDRVKT